MKLIWAAAAAASLCGCAFSSRPPIYVPLDQLESFTARPSARRILHAPVIQWQVREDAASFCRGLLGITPHGGPHSVVLACALWEASKNQCTIVTEPVVSYAVLGHELRHCYEGNFH